MGSLSIKLNIANRIYPLSIDRKDEAKVRKAAKMIEDSLKVYEENYSVRDKQDLLAMCALEYANQVLEEDGKVKIVFHPIAKGAKHPKANVFTVKLSKTHSGLHVATNSFPVITSLFIFILFSFSECKIVKN